MPTLPGSGEAEVRLPASSEPSRLPGLFRLGLVGWVSILLLGCLVIRIGRAANVVIHTDEFHFFHSAWMTGHGYLPYRDFWTNNSPLFMYLLTPVVAYFDENPSSLLAIARLLNLMINLGLVGIVGVIASQQRSWTTGLFAALPLSFNLIVFIKMVTVRHDSPTLICELVALVLLARGMRAGHHPRLGPSLESEGVVWGQRARHRLPRPSCLLLSRNRASPGHHAIWRSDRIAPLLP